MRTVVMCRPEQSCNYQRETGGECGVRLELHCQAETCPFPAKPCVFVEMGGVRPDGRNP